MLAREARRGALVVGPGECAAAGAAVDHATRRHVHAARAEHRPPFPFLVNRSVMPASLRSAFPLAFLAVLLSGCDLVGDVVEFGLWTLLILLLVAAAVVYLVVKTFFD